MTALVEVPCPNCDEKTEHTIELCGGTLHAPGQSPRKCFADSHSWEVDCSSCGATLVLRVGNPGEDGQQAFEVLVKDVAPSTPAH